MGLTSGIENLFSSIFEIFQGFINTILSAFQSVFALAKNLIASIFDLLSGVVGFVLGMFNLSSSLLECVLSMGRLAKTYLQAIS